MTDEVAALVLEDNRLQALGLSIAQAGEAKAVPAQLHLIERLEALGQLDRKTEGLADADVLLRRAADGHGLTRPELAVLLSCAKLAMQEALEASALPDDPGLASDLLAAFPKPMRGKFEADILAHRLRREIIATKLTNRMINRLGVIHPYELAEEEGATLAQVAAAFVAAERLLNMGPLWQAIETGAMSEEARIVLFDYAAAAMSDHIADILRIGGGTLVPSKLVADLAPGVKELSHDTGSLLAGEGRSASAAMVHRLGAAGAPAALAAAVAKLFDMDGAIGLASLAREQKLSARGLTSAFSDLGARLGLDWAQQTAARMSPSDPWERLLINGLARDFQQMRLDFLRRRGGKQAAAAVESWADSQAQAIAQFRTVIARAQGAMPVAPAMLAQIASQARNLLGR
jgi:glutamate dehydrogenase